MNSSSQKSDLELHLLPKKKRLSQEKEIINPSNSAPPKQPFFKFMTFFDMWNLIKSINIRKDPLKSDDLPQSFNFCKVEQKVLDLEREWKRQLSKKQPSIINAVLLAFRKEILVVMTLCFLTISAKFFTLPLMGDIINNISIRNFGQETDLNALLWTSILFTIGTVILIVVQAWYWHLVSVIAATCRNTIIGFTYRKLQSVTLSSIQQINIGKVVNLLSNDVNELDKGLIFVFPMILCPYTLCVTGVLMYKFFGFSTIFGMLGLVGFLLTSNYLSDKTQSIRAERSVITDSRIKLTNELIECIRLIKMYAWEKAFKQTIQILRDKEVLKLARLRMISVLGESMGATSAQISLAIMCIIYVLTGGVLTPEKIFTSLILLTSVSIWGIEFFHNGIMFVAASKVMKERLESILLIKETSIRDDEDTYLSKSKTSIEYKNYNGWWQDQNKALEKACLKNLNLKLNPGCLTTVIGTVGSGKTSFLLSLLREIPESQGELVVRGKTAYVEQEPIIFSGTVRSNILFGLEYDEQFYQTVVRACNLRDDFQQFTDSDDTIVGERGITLSGGQKARLSLARALYSKSDIYLLDDPLSAVDSKVGRHLFNYAIKGQLLKDKIVVLATHHLDYAKESDRVLLFNEGEIIGDGSFEELRNQGNTLFDKFKEIENEERRKSTHRNSTTIVKISKEESQEVEAEKKPEKDIDQEDDNKPITFATYKKYIDQNGSYKYFTGVVSYCMSYALFFIGFARFLGFWSQNNFEHQQHQDSEAFNHTPYIVLVIVLALLALFGDAFKFILCNNFILKANSHMHSKALEKVANAPVSFFDKTPIGTALNRFSNDLGILDKGNAELLPYVLDGCFYVGMRMVALVIINPALLIPVAFVAIMSIKIKLWLEKPVMETKRIDLTSKSPLYSEISATINGLLIIRTFRQSVNFVERFSKLVQLNNRAFLYMDRTLKFFAVLMSIILDGLSIFGTFLCIAVAYYTNFDAALFGLALLMFQEIAGYGNWLVRISLQVDINMQSVERIMKYYQLDSEPPKSLPYDKQPIENQSWPQNGQVTFNNVYMKYRPEFDYVLQGLTFSIPAGCKVGIVGRTGAGKSSIIQALFRMVKIETGIPGSSVQIDNINTSEVGLDLLRQSLSIIPQTPVVFTGTIRRNLDPFDEFSDSQLWESLSEVNLKKYVETLENQLNTDMTMSSSVFSAGQKQLVCLARTLLRKNKIIVLDEATANVDIETDEFIQNKIMERFKDCTVITIAHRLITIANYDKIIVMDKGRVIESDSPYALMVKSKGDRSITSQDGVFADMVRKSGDGVASKIFEIAKNKYYQN